MHSHLDHLGLCQRQLGLEGINLLLEGRDGTHTSIHRIPDPCIRFIHHATDSIAALVDWQLLCVVENAIKETFKHKGIMVLKTTVFVKK